MITKRVINNIIGGKPRRDVRSRNQTDLYHKRLKIIQDAGNNKPLTKTSMRIIQRQMIAAKADVRLGQLSKIEADAIDNIGENIILDIAEKLGLWEETRKALINKNW